MAGQQDSDESKPHEPTAKKLEDQRKKGEVPKSSDLSGAVAYFGLLLALVGIGGWIVRGLGEVGMTLIGQSHRLAPMFLSGHGAALHGALLSEVGGFLAPLFGLPMVLVLLGLIAQRGLVFAPSKLAPKVSRISPVSNAKQKFGLSGLMEFAKSFAKLLLFSSALGVFLVNRVDTLLIAATLDPGPAALLIGRLAVEFLVIVVLISACIGAVDMVWQVADHRRRNRMSHKELKDEMKESEGDPHFKERRREKGMSIAQNRMIADVPGSTVVIVNPTHYAVALAWTPGAMPAPVCMAKGVDEVAARIREAAAEAGVPIHRDPPTARALHATVDIGAEIDPEHYVKVAAAVRFADAVRARAKRSVL